jgi:hypothetical protein
MTTTPPRGATQVTGSTEDTHLPISGSLRTPAECDPGITRSGPLSAWEAPRICMPKEAPYPDATVSASSRLAFSRTGWREMEWLSHSATFQRVAQAFLISPERIRPGSTSSGESRRARAVFHSGHP